LLRIHFLGSGSAGNASLVQHGETRLLLDCGFTAREIGRRLEQVGQDPRAIQAVLVTHEHTDHVRGLPVFARTHGIPVYLTARTAPAVRLGPRGKVARCEVRPRQPFRIGDLEIVAFPTVHDARESVGYIFAAPDGTRLGIATDLGRVSPEAVEALAGCHLLGLEANHDPRMLMEGPYPWFLKRRIQSERGHLSNAEAADLLGRVAGPQLRHLFALHLSKTNNRPALARRALQDGLSRLGLEVPVTVVGQDEPVSPLDHEQLDMFNNAHVPWENTT
jgi:phosphoribosyl 1,2-cyclic phosphodiesterase